MDASLSDEHKTSYKLMSYILLTIINKLEKHIDTLANGGLNHISFLLLRLLFRLFFVVVETQASVFMSS